MQGPFLSPLPTHPSTPPPPPPHPRPIHPPTHPPTHPRAAQDGTLVNTKSGAQFARGPDDWKLFNKKVPEVVKMYHKEGYKIVVFRSVRRRLRGHQHAGLRRVHAWLDGRTASMPPPAMHSPF